MSFFPGCPKHVPDSSSNISTIAEAMALREVKQRMVSLMDLTTLDKEKDTEEKVKDLVPLAQDSMRSVFFSYFFQMFFQFFVSVFFFLLWPY